jgi:hypothetical protein
MPKDKDNRRKNTGEETGCIDREILDVIHEEQRKLAGGASHESDERKRILKIFSGKALSAIQAKDARAFAVALREANVTENSPEWKRAWELFRSSSA